MAKKRPRHLNTSVVVSCDFSDKDKGVLIVGKPHGGAIDIINAYDGAEAWELWNKLVTKKED